MGISIEDIKTLRAKTSAGIGLCKEALTQSNGDMQKAIEYINNYYNNIDFVFFNKFFHSLVILFFIDRNHRIIPLCL